MEVYKIESEQELLEKMNEEIEMLESIFPEDVIMEKISKVEIDEADASTNGSGGSDKDDSEPMSQF